MNNKNNILVIDDNKSINYQKSNTNNSYVYELAIEELYQIYQENKCDIFKHNTEKCLSLILSDGKEISLHDYINTSAKPIFMKITNNELAESDNDILIAIDNDHHIGGGLFEFASYADKENGKWCMFCKLLTSAGKDPVTGTDIITDSSAHLSSFNGYQDSIRIYQNRKENDFPAIWYCLKQKIKIGKNKYQGYLPAIGQLYLIYGYKDMINFILQYINSTILFDIDEKYNNSKQSWWSSTMHEDVNAWHLTGGDDYVSVITSEFNVFPLFKKIN